MGRVCQSVLEAIGWTPLVEFCNLEKEYELKARLLGKIEGMNPAGSAKDRVAREMIRDAEKKGLLKSGATIIEPTSGNTGIGLASMAAILGYKLILTMPDTMSEERIRMLKAYGAEVVLTPGVKGMAGSIRKAEELAQEIPNSFIPGQFTNKANAAAHYKTTGPEIWLDTEGEIDIFVAAVGTGGTLTGVGTYLKDKNSAIEIIAVEPKNSAVLSGEDPGSHKLQGMGAGFVPKILNTGLYSEVMKMDDEVPFSMAKEIAQKEGILVGISAGAAVAAAIKVAGRPENAGKTVVALLPDNGDRYYSTELFQD